MEPLYLWKPLYFYKEALKVKEIKLKKLGAERPAEIKVLYASVVMSREAGLKQ